MRPLAAYLRSLNPRLPRSVQALQTGGLFNAFGNGLVLPFTLWENVMLGHQTSDDFSNGPWLDRKGARTQ